MNLIKGMAHIAVRTTSLEESIAFYVKLGAMLCERGTIETAEGETKLASLALAGVIIELVEPHDGSVVLRETGAVAHIAFEVSDLDEVVREIKGAGIDSFLTQKPKSMPKLFGGLKNIFFTGPSNEEIELVQKL